MRNSKEKLQLKQNFRDQLQKHVKLFNKAVSTPDSD